MQMLTCHTHGQPASEITQTFNIKRLFKKKALKYVLTVTKSVANDDINL